MSQEEILSKAITEYIDNQQKRASLYQNYQFLSFICSGAALLLVLFSFFISSTFGWKQECTTRQINATESLQVCRRA